MYCLTTIFNCGEWDKGSCVKNVIIPSIGTAIVGSYAISWWRYKIRQKELNIKRRLFQKSFREQLDTLEASLVSKRLLTEQYSDYITTLNYAALRSKLLDGELTCVEVLYAYQAKALIENKKYNFIAGLILEAEAWARQLDDLPIEVKAGLPLLGMPVSVKENYDIEGYCSTMGCSRRIGLLSKKTNGTIEVLKNAGALPFIRTNLPQTMVSLAAHNPIFGQTRNPLDISRSPGGSSSGEAASIAAGCSLLGLGTDLGGSVRVPAAWCGVFGLKPTFGRILTNGIIGASTGKNAVNGVQGFLSKDVSILIETLKTLSSQKVYETQRSMARIIFDDEELMSNRKLRIGYITSSTIPVTESATVAVMEVVSELAKLGHEMIVWAPPDVEGINPAELMLVSCFADAGKSMKDLLYADEVSYALRPLMRMLLLPRRIKILLGYLLSWFMPSWWVYKNLTGPAGLGSCSLWFDHVLNVEAYKEAWIDNWMKLGLDAVITPSTPIPAEIIDESGPNSGCGGFTYLCNLVNFPAGVVPWRKITPEEELNDLENFPDSDIIKCKMRKSVEGSAGLPLSVHVITMPYREELCLRIMKTIDDLRTTQGT